MRVLCWLGLHSFFKTKSDPRFTVLEHWSKCLRCGEWKKLK